MLILAFSLVLIAGIFQGTFVLPMTLTKKWEWEHTWATFSLLGMLIFNWILTVIFIPNTFSIYSSVPSRDIIILILFGTGWGVGAILFGLGMDKLGMAFRVSYNHGTYCQPWSFNPTSDILPRIHT